MLSTLPSFPSSTDSSPLISTYLSIRNDIITLLKKISNHLNFKSQTFFLSITYMDELVHVMPQHHNDNIIIVHNDLYIKALTCLVIASKYQEIDYIIPNLRKYIECYRMYSSKHSMFVTMEMLRCEEVNVLVLLKYKLCYYSVYDYIVFMFCHGVVTQDELKRVDNNNNNEINDSKMKRSLERIYIKARELLDKVIYMEEMVYHVCHRAYFAIYITERSVKEVLCVKQSEEGDIAFRKVVIEVYKSDNYYKDETFEKIKQKIEECCKCNSKMNGNDNDKGKKLVKQSSTSLSRMYLQNNYRLFNSNNNNNIYKIQRNNFYSCNNSATNIFNVVQNNSNTNCDNINKHERHNNNNNGLRGKSIYSNVTILHMKPHNEHTYNHHCNLLNNFHLLPTTSHTLRAISSYKHHHLHQRSVISTQDILHKTKQLLSKALPPPSSSSSSTSFKRSNILLSSIKYNKLYNYN